MYKIIVWHKNATEGTHQSILLEAQTLGKVMRDFDKYLKDRKGAHQSFNERNLIQLHHVDRGVLAHFPASLRA